MGLASDLGLTAPQRSAVRRSGQLIASSPAGTWLASRLMPTIDRAAARITRGRVTVSERTAGIPTLFLTTTGARTGIARTVPLAAVRDGEDIAVIGSNWGRRSHPAWVHNLLADPRASLTWRGRTVDVVATEVADADAERIWARARALYRGFRVYPERTEGRAIRVFLLRRANQA
jgi:deazaflavin-dependent oxidoreductase (nitroreductase family)